MPNLELEPLAVQELDDLLADLMEHVREAGEPNPHAPNSLTNRMTGFRMLLLQAS